MKKSKYYLFFALPVLLICSSCVTAGKYKQLENEFDAAQSRIAELEGKLGIVSSERTQLSKEKSDLSSSNEEMKRALEELQKRKQEAEKRLADYRELTQKFSKLVDAGKLKIKFINGKMVLALSTDILFSSGSAALSPGGKSAIKEVTGVLASLQDKKFQIEGHTDNEPIVKKKQFASNWELASARAMSVLNTMLSSGMPENRISAASYGSTQPVAKNSSSAGKAANRRISIVVVPDLSGLPGFSELSKMSSEN